MSKKNVQSFKYNFSQNLKPLQKVKTEWDLKKIFYTSEHDVRIMHDVETMENEYATFARTYKSGTFLKTHKSLLKALTAYETLAGRPEGRRALRYFGYRHSLNASDSVAEKKINIIEGRLIKASNSIIFFELMLGSITKKEQGLILANPLFAHFTYFLKRIFEEAKHTLTEKEEKILGLTSQTACGMWVDATQKIMSNRMITYEGKHIAIPEAHELINLQKPHKKQKLWNSILTELEQISEVAENEFNAIVTYKKTTDELRGFKTPYSATMLGYENNEKSVEALIHAVSTRGFELSKRFYTLKAKYHKVKTIPYVQKYDSLGEPLRFSFEESLEICRDVFYSVDTSYGKFFDDMFLGGRVDVYPKKGKRGGAFESSDVNLPIFVFLNHTNDLNSLTTLAHEMGHALHSHRSKTLSPFYEEFSTTTAETMSTLFENILFDALLQSATEAQKLSLLHERIMRTVSSVSRQIAFINFEMEMHERIRKEGALTKIELRDMMTKHLKSYLGPNVEVSERDGYSYVMIPHFRYGFYVYTYAYGELMSMLMAEKLSSDRTYVQKIDTFLSSGRTDTVENIFKKIGIDTTSQKTFTLGLSKFENDINTFEELIKNH